MITENVFKNIATAIRNKLIQIRLLLPFCFFKKKKLISNCFNLIAVKSIPIQVEIIQFFQNKQTKNVNGKKKLWKQLQTKQKWFLRVPDSVIQNKKKKS